MGSRRYITFPPTLGPGLMKISVSAFEDSRKILCETAWLHDEPCDPVIVPKIFHMANMKEKQSEEAMEQKEFTTLIYLMVLGIFYLALAAILVATTVTRTRRTVLRMVATEVGEDDDERDERKQLLVVDKGEVKSEILDGVNNVITQL